VYDQDGFLDYARAMRAVESSIPIKIGATMLPIDGENVIPIEIDSLSEIFTEMDFWILHQYNSGTPYNNYQLRRQLSDNRISNMIDRQNLIQDFLNYTNINREIGLAITEWNMFLKDTYQPIDRTIECAIFTTQWMVGILNGEMNGNFNFNYAEQFALHGGNLSLISVYGEPHRVISPTAYVFKGFKPWVNMELLPLIIESPEELAYDKEIELIQTAVSRNITGDTLRMVITNNSEIDTIRCNLDLENFNYNTIQIQKLTGENYFSNNDIDANNVTLISEYLYINDNLLFIPPHSVNFLTLFYSELLGDINQDGEVNILDIIIAVDLTLNNEFNPLADLNSDRNVNVVDIVQIINIILEE
jgi:alpha-L-arabinofuranosidase